MSVVPATRLHSFPPVIRLDARLLILGSMPGAASLAAQQYYAHPQNQFWPIMERLFGVRSSLPYERRLLGLQHRRVALWDVLHSCVRCGSLDAAIEHGSAVPNDLPLLLRAHPRIERVCCNGGTAYRALQRYFGAQLQREFPQLVCLRLPSTSPAHARMRPADKLRAWHGALKDA
ncbi:MAG TPA: DNA-deoxyinosine glycosylase [Steroidobacteraceae bacterium]